MYRLRITPTYGWKYYDDIETAEKIVRAATTDASVMRHHGTFIGSRGASRWSPPGITVVTQHQESVMLIMLAFSGEPFVMKEE